MRYTRALHVYRLQQPARGLGLGDHLEEKPHDRNCLWNIIFFLKLLPIIQLHNFIDNVYPVPVEFHCVYVN